MAVIRKITKVIIILTFAWLLGSFAISSLNDGFEAQAAAKEVKSLSIKNPKITIEQDDIEYIKFKVKAAKGASKKVTARSSNKKVASIYWVDNSEIGIEGKKPGTATITVTTKGKNVKGKKLSKKIKVTVTAEDSAVPASDGTQNTNANTIIQSANETPNATPGYVDVLKSHINNKGFTNTNGHKAIKDSYIFDDGTIASYVVVNDTDAGVIDMVFILSDKYTTTVSLAIPFPSTKGTLSITQLDKEGAFSYSDDFNVDISSITSNNSYVYYSDGSNLSESKNGLNNSSLNLACLMWDDLLKTEVGFGLYELGFTSYR